MTRNSNIISYLPGVIGQAKIYSEKSALECVVTSETLQEILIRTHHKLACIRIKYSDSNKQELKELYFSCYVFCGLHDPN